MATKSPSIIPTASKYDQLFRPAPEAPPLELPGAKGRERSREIFEGLPPGSLAPATKLTPEQHALVDAVVEKLAKIARNTNFTMQLPAHSQPMYWSNNIDLSDTVVMADAVTPWQTVLEYTAPDSRYGRIAQYGFDVTDPTYPYDGTLLWRITLNGVPVQSLVSFGEHRGSMVEPADTYIIVPQGQTVRFEISRTATGTGALTVAMKMKGWDWLLRNNNEGTKASVTAP